MRSDRTPLHLGWFTLVAVLLGPMVGALTVVIATDIYFGTFKLASVFWEMRELIMLVYGVGVPCALVLCAAMWAERRWLSDNRFWRMLMVTALLIPLLYLCVAYVAEAFRRDNPKFDFAVLRSTWVLIGLPSVAAGTISWVGTRLLQWNFSASKAVGDE